VKRRALLLVLFAGLLMGVGDRYPDIQPEGHTLTFGTSAGTNDGFCLRAAPNSNAGSSACTGPLTLAYVSYEDRTPILTRMSCSLTAAGSSPTAYTITPEWVFSDSATGTGGTTFDTPVVISGGALSFGAENAPGSWRDSGLIHGASTYSGPQFLQLRLTYTGTSHGGASCTAVIEY
jgi:hypothetical protein